MLRKNKPISQTDKLKRGISRFWLKEIQALYNAGNICSESHFKGEFFSLLKKKFPTKHFYQIWVEPAIPQLDNLTINLLVSFHQTIITAIELKYIPHGFPRYENNFLKFEKIRTHSNLSVYLKTNPVSGFADQTTAYLFDENCLFVFAAIARYNSDAFHDKTWEQLTGNKLMLIGKVDSPDAKLFEVSPEFGKR